MKRLELYVSDPHAWTIPQLLVEIENLTGEISKTWSSFPGSTLESGMMLAHTASILTLKLHEELTKRKLSRA